MMLRVHPSDNVAVALVEIVGGVVASIDGLTITAQETIPAGHKVALAALPAGARIVKYGSPIGSLTAPVAAGAWVHSHNLATDLGVDECYDYAPIAPSDRAGPTDKGFLGYRRADGRVGTRNELWVLNTVGCVNGAAAKIAAEADRRFGPATSGVIDGAFAFAHPYGCSQLGDDLDNTRRVIAGLMRHPNAGGVLVVGLGCENNQVRRIVEGDGGIDPARLRWFNAQEAEDEIATGVAMAEELVAVMAADKRSAASLADLAIGVKCGGSDGLSGLTANPLVGRITDRVADAGGRVILTEVPEMFGAERLLMARAKDRATFDATVALIERFKAYFTAHGQPIYENPSPGNKAGGLTTLEEKSLGAVQKSGSATIAQVLGYGDAATEPGLALLEAPGNDAVSSTAAAVSGATLLLFTTGRGTPLGFPVPTIKIASNSALAARKPGWIDFDAGPIADGVAVDTLADDLLDHILAVASGERTRNEIDDVREIAIWKTGVTL